MTDEERETLAIHARIIAALLLILQEAEAQDELRAKTLVFLEYASALVRTKYDFMMAALDVICYPVESLGLNWKIIEESTSVQVLTDLIIRNMKLDREHPEELSFTGHGKVLCRDGVLKVCSSEVVESGSLAFSVCQERVEVITRNSRDERLKASDQFNAEDISTFADFFRKTQKSFVDSSPKTRSYVEGDKVPIQITDIDSVAGIVKAKVMDSDVFIKGEIDCEEELIKGVYAKDIIPYLFDEDCIRDAILLRDEKGWYFSIRDTYSAYAQAMADSDARCGIHFEAVVIRVMPGWKRVNWITPSGYGGITRLEDTPGVKVGDKAVLRVFNIKSSGGDTYINLRPVEPVNNSFSKFVEVDSVLERFVAPLEEVAMNKETIPATELNRQRDYIKILSAILFNTAYRGDSIDAYRHLLVAEFLAQVVEDNASERIIREESDYLLQRLLFAQCGKVMLDKSKMLSEEDSMLCQQLSNWDSNAVFPLISDSFGRKKKEAEILSLMQGVWISEQFPDEVRVDKENVRKKICEVLGVGDSFVRGGSVPKGKYGKVEMHKVEFKSSYVFRNDKKKVPVPDLVAQGKGEVFRSVCGFLNADGGVVYIGVNDDGDPIIAKDRGLNADKTWLKANRDRINKQRVKELHHFVINDNIDQEGNLDTYVQFLNCEKELYFTDSLQDNIRIEVTEDNDAIRILVKPAEYEIAYLFSDTKRCDGVAYVRSGSSTIKMSPAAQEKRMVKLKKISNEIKFVVIIQEAIATRKRLIFKDYASGNSGEVRDRHVVPVNLFYHDENVYCYDLDSKKYKQFRLYRIGSIEEGAPYPLPIQKEKKADVFRWILPEGGRPYHIKLRMDVGARNYLLEEYSCAKDLPATQFYEDKKDKWILDTNVNGLGAVRRFYLGLADKIEILDTEDSEELKNEIASYAKSYIIT